MEENNFLSIHLCSVAGWVTWQPMRNCGKRFPRYLCFFFLFLQHKHMKYLDKVFKRGFFFAQQNSCSVQQPPSFVPWRERTPNSSYCGGWFGHKCVNVISSAQCPCLSVPILYSVEESIRTVHHQWKLGNWSTWEIWRWWDNVHL